MRGGRPDRGIKSLHERPCAQCGALFTPSKSDHNCIRCPECRRERNQKIQAECIRCDSVVLIHPSLWFSRVLALSKNGYICAPCQHTLRARAVKAKLAGKEVDPAIDLKDCLKAPCGYIWRTKHSQRCERTWTQEGYCDHYWDCVELSIKHNWPGWRRVDDVPLRDSRRKWYAECAI